LTIGKRPLSIVRNRFRSGSVLLVVVVLVALLAAVVMGHLQINAEEMQLEQNHLGGVQSLALAEAGLNDALAQLRRDPGWNVGFTDKPFDGGTYTVVVQAGTVTSTAVTSRGFLARIEAGVAPRPGGPGGPVEIHRWRINP
jgi:hypothetical protein